MSTSADPSKTTREPVLAASEPVPTREPVKPPARHKCATKLLPAIQPRTSVLQVHLDKIDKVIAVTPRENKLRICESLERIPNSLHDIASLVDHFLDREVPRTADISSDRGEIAASYVGLGIDVQDMLLSTESCLREIRKAWTTGSEVEQKVFDTLFVTINHGELIQKSAAKLFEAIKPEKNSTKQQLTNLGHNLSSFGMMLARMLRFVLTMVPASELTGVGLVQTGAAQPK